MELVGNSSIPKLKSTIYCQIWNSAAQQIMQDRRLWPHNSVTSRCPPPLMSVSSVPFCPLFFCPHPRHCPQSPVTLVCWPGAWSWLLSRGILTCPLGFLLSQPSGPVSTLSAALKSKPCQVNCNNQIQKPHTEYSLTAHLIEPLIEFYLYISPVPDGEGNTIDIEIWSCYSLHVLQWAGTSGVSCNV